MTITREQVDSTLIISLHGKLDTNAAPDLEEELYDSMDGIKELIFESKDLEYLTSAGIRVLVAAQQEMIDKGYMLLRNVCDDIMEIFEMTGLDEVFSFE